MMDVELLFSYSYFGCHSFHTSLDVCSTEELI